MPRVQRRVEFHCIDADKLLERMNFSWSGTCRRQLVWQVRPAIVADVRVRQPMTESPENSCCSILQVLRVRQWIKNGFVVAPLLFSGEFTEGRSCLLSLAAFLSFCAISSAIYAVNDLCDRAEDREHPEKRHRPIARGAVTTRQAVILSAVLAAFSLLLGFGLGMRVGVMVAIYAMVNVLYSLWLKHVAILDVMIIAGGFVLRILAGAVAIDVVASHWLILCTIMISMFLGFTKRRAEIVSAEGAGEHTRVVLKDYSVAFLDQAIAMVTGATLVCYALYTVDPETMARFGNRTMLLTVPSVIFGLFRYIYIIYHQKGGQDPARSVSRDIPMLVNLIIWVGLCLAVIGYGDQITRIL